MKGIYPALLTPFDKGGGVHEHALEALVDMNMRKGVDGFYVCGSTAEAFLLSMDERKRILELVASMAKGRCRVIAHIGCIGLDHALELAKHARQSGADAISSVPPFYYPFSFKEIKDYYFRIAEETGLPMLLYNFPSFSGVNFTLDQIRCFMENGRFIGVKHTSSDFYMLERVKALYPDKIVFNGYDEMFLSGLAMGADGGIGSTYNFMAEKFIRIRRLFNQGEIEKARQIQRVVNEIITVLKKVGELPGEKAILEMMGLDFGICRKPFKTLTEEERAYLYNAAEKLLKDPDA